AGPVALPTPPGVRRIDVRSAQGLREAVLAALPGQDAYLGAAAVADYTPGEVREHKIKKTGETLVLELVRTPDVLAEVAAHPQRPRLVVGFAAETEDMEAYARDKLARKRLDLIAANPVGGGRGFEADDNALTVYWQDGHRDIPRAPKAVVARQLLELIADRLEGQ